MKLKKIIIFLFMITSIKIAYPMNADSSSSIQDFNKSPFYKSLPNGLGISRTPLTNENGDIVEVVYQGYLHNNTATPVIVGKIITGPNKDHVTLYTPNAPGLTPQEAFEELKSEFDKAPLDPVIPRYPQGSEIERPQRPV